MAAFLPNSKVSHIPVMYNTELNVHSEKKILTKNIDIFTKHLGNTYWTELLCTIQMG